MTRILKDSVRALLLEKLRQRDELRSRLQDPEVAADGRLSAELRKQEGALDRIVGPFEVFLSLEKELEEARALAGGDDPEMRDLAGEEVARLEESLEAQAREVLDGLVEGEEEVRGDSLIMEIRAGTGGEEACLFVRDLLRMYSRFCEIKGWKQETIALFPTERGGFREAIFSIKGKDAWKYLRYESGGHRVQRVPETESQGRIHTSAATVAVLPEPEEVDVQIQSKDLRVETMRASGPGGQHVNKTSSDVRITHIPSGIVVVCQDEKSQHKNRVKAMRVLRSRIFERERLEKNRERARERRSQIGSGDRNQRVRTYNFPQNRVTDHRLKENFSLEQIMDGKMENLLGKLLQKDREERIKAL